MQSLGTDVKKKIKSKTQTARGGQCLHPSVTLMIQTVPFGRMICTHESIPHFQRDAGLFRRS